MIKKIINILKGTRQMTTEEIEFRTLIFNLATEQEIISKEQLKKVLEDPKKLNDLNNLTILINEQTSRELKPGEQDYSQTFQEYLIKEAKQ